MEGRCAFFCCLLYFNPQFYHPLVDFTCKITAVIITVVLPKW